ncbi:MAG: serine/threonine-protein kinase [Kofleriaceae bacterium]
MVGTSVGRYVLGGQLGVGGMGVVYATELDGRALAIKILHPERVVDPHAIALLHEEACALERVDHPNVVAVVDHGSHGGIPYLVMERARGMSLGVLLRYEGRLALGRAVAIVIEILAGLQAAHSSDVVHGDIKSENILIETDGSDTIKIIDFGLALHVNQAPHVEQDREGGQIAYGTPEYMAPEVIRGEHASPASDLYAVGVILYELVTGHRPFEGGAPASILARHLEDHVVPPSLRRPDRDIPHALEQMILRALRKQAAAHQPSAAAFAADLAAAFPARDNDAVPTDVTEPRSAETTTGVWVSPSSQLAGARPGIEERVSRYRRELALAIKRGEPDEAVTAALAVARALIDDHAVTSARLALESTVDELTRGEGAEAPDAPEPLWRLLLTLATLYQNLHEPLRAHRMALAGYHLAVRWCSDLGRERASSLLARLDRRAAG